MGGRVLSTARRRERWGDFFPFFGLRANVGKHIHIYNVLLLCSLDSHTGKIDLSLLYSQK